MTRASTGWERLRADAPGLALRLTLLALLLDGSLFWFQRVPVTVVAGLGLLLPGAARSRELWFGLALLTGWPLVWNWPFSDNHDYLRAFWCLALACGLSSGSPRLAIAAGGRLLIGWTFFFATLWKLALSPDYMDGTFFRVALMTDGRFQELAVLLGGLSDEILEANDAALHAVFSGSVDWAGSGFTEPAAARRLAGFLTLYTVVIEAVIAALFLWPRAPAWLRDATLLVFACTTFAFATVRGFGWLLMALGVAQSEPERRPVWAAYVAVFFLIEAYRSVPWAGALVGLVGS